MKIRNGFVSNSSSSSFIAKGFVLDREEYKKYEEEIAKAFNITWETEGFDDYEIYDNRKEALNNSELFIAENIEDGAPKDKVIIGETIEDLGEDDYYFHNHTLDCEPSEILNKIKSIIGEHPVKIIVGTKSC